MLSKLTCEDKTAIQLEQDGVRIPPPLFLLLTLTKHNEFYLYIWVSFYHELLEIRKVLHKVYGVDIILRDVQRLQSFQGDLWKCCEVVAGEVQGLDTLHVFQYVSRQIL